ncbi:hypothetical protein [Streptomyces sp. NPDC003077]|uniref:hypothetical protein n=1 Tax=Streptomyces sp. NPDC003077 TaxID=3154443 RepID=UPI0033BE2BFC
MGFALLCALMTGTTAMFLVGDGPADRRPAGESAAPHLPSGARPPDGYQRMRDPAGYRLDVPVGWNRSTKDGSVFYTSPDGKSIIQIFSPGGHRTPYDSLKAAEVSLRKQPGFRRVRAELIGPYVNEGAQLEYLYQNHQSGLVRVLVRYFSGADKLSYALLLIDPADQGSGPQRQRQRIILRSFCPITHCPR